MDFHNLTLHGTQQSQSGSDQSLWRSFQVPTRSSTRWQRHEPIAWKEVFEGPRECKNPILLSEPGQKVIRAIREIYGPRQAVTNQCTPQQGKSFCKSRPSSSSKKDKFKRPYISLTYMEMKVDQQMAFNIQ